MKARKPQISKEIYELVVSIVDDKLKGIVATRAEFEALKDSVDKLAEAQRRTEEVLESFKRATEENFSRVWRAIEALTDRLDRLTERVDQLAEAQLRTEERLNRLTERVDGLAIKVEELTDRLNRLTEKVDRLAEAQLKTEQSLIKVRMDLAGLSRSFSYAFENEAFRHLPRFLKEKYGIEVVERLIRKEVLFSKN